MLRVKYKFPTSGANKGKTPHETIIANTTPPITRGEIKAGQFPQIVSSEKWLYADINCLPADEAGIISACADWGMVQLNDTDAKAFADAHGDPPGTVTQPKCTTNAATIVNNLVVRTVTEEY